MVKLTAVQQQAFNRIQMIRQLEQRSGQTYGSVEKKVLDGLQRADVIAVIDAMIEAGGALAGFNTGVEVTK
jgi:hypothetical protein